MINTAAAKVGDMLTVLGGIARYGRRHAQMPGCGALAALLTCLDHHKATLELGPVETNLPASCRVEIPDHVLGADRKSGKRLDAVASNAGGTVCADRFVHRGETSSPLPSVSIDRRSPQTIVFAATI